jgi:hypothetical protein
MSANLDALTSASTPAAVARTVTEHAFDLAGFLEQADLPGIVEAEVRRDLTNLRGRLAAW